MGITAHFCLTQAWPGFSQPLTLELMPSGWGGLGAAGSVSSRPREPPSLQSLGPEVHTREDRTRLTERARKSVCGLSSVVFWGVP